jgi:hypothetical protein
MVANKDEYGNDYALNSYEYIDFLPSSVLAEFSFIITSNNLTPSPPHFGKESKWNKISKERLEL